MSKAIFLDRDGTINTEVNYLDSKEKIQILPGTITALKKFKDLGFLNIIITNQSGIARGILTEEELQNIHDEFRVLLKNDGTHLIDDIFYSPYHIDGIIDGYNIDSDDRKPNTGMILKASSKYNIELPESYFIGDSFTDMKCAANAGLRKILVKTGYGKDDYKKCIDAKIDPDFFAEDLLDASVFIEKNLTKNSD